jgi:branched-chain amino acid aminotransferase
MKTTLNSNAVPAEKRTALIAEGGFGKYYTDHMVICEWSESQGWSEPELVPYGPITLVMNQGEDYAMTRNHLSHILS